MAHMATELSALSSILPTMIPSSSKLYPIATSQYDYCTPADISIPSVQSMKRKLTISTRGSSPPAKKEKAEEPQHVHHQVPKALPTPPSESTEVIRRSCSSTSVTHHTLLHFKSQLEEIDRVHNLALAEQPDNPILSETGKPRFTFSTYQMKAPTEVMIEVLKDEPRCLDFLAGNADFWRGICIFGRLKRKMCLRDWEWSIGEPQRLPSDEIINESAAHVNNRKEKDKPALNAREDNMRFVERVENFTYMRKDDPIFRGRKVVLGKEDRPKWVRGSFPDEVDDEVFEYDTDFEDTCTDEQEVEDQLLKIQLDKERESVKIKRKHLRLLSG